MTAWRDHSVSVPRLLQPLLAVAVSCALAAASWAADGEARLESVKVTTSGSVDTSSYESIVRDLCKPGMSSETKAIALFDWFERSTYHRITNPDVNWNPHKVINVYGGITCGTQGSTMAGLCRLAGLEARVVSTSDGSHTFYEVKYDGSWHGFDTMDRLWVYTRGEPKQVASHQALKDDPTLATKAVEEGRACPGFLFHGDKAEWFTTGIKVLGYTPTFIQGLEQLNLTPGQKVTWYWYNTNKIHPDLMTGNPGKLGGMIHSCSRRADARNPLSFPFWEPYYYLTPGCHPEQQERRMYGNGVLAFEPDLTGKAITPGFSQVTNLAGPGLVPVAADKPGSATYLLHSPWLLVGGKLTLKVAPGASLDTIKVELTKNGKDFQPAKAALSPQGELELTSALVPAWSYDFGFRLTLPDARAALAGVRLELDFMHNKYVAPFLVPGNNTVKFTTSNPATLANFPATIEYAWQEGPDWDKAEVKTNVHVASSTAACEWPIQIGGTRNPRMKSLSVSVGVTARAK